MRIIGGMIAFPKVAGRGKMEGSFFLDVKDIIHFYPISESVYSLYLFQPRARPKVTDMVNKLVKNVQDLSMKNMTKFNASRFTVKV